MRPWSALLLLLPALACGSSGPSTATAGSTTGGSTHAAAGSTGGGTGGTSGNGSGSSGGSSGGNSSSGSSSGGASSATATAGTTGGGTSAGGSTGDTWTNWASPSFFQVYCTSCHTAGGQGDPSGSGLDFTQYADVQANAATIRCGVAVTQDPSWGCASFPPAQQFPIGNGPHPTNSERDRLVGWIDAGLPQ